jgi:hypothetical protein
MKPKGAATWWPPVHSPLALCIELCLLCVLAAVAGESFSAFYSFSDGLTYSLAYEALQVTSPSDAFITFALMTGAAEPLSFAVFYLASQFVSLELLNGALNVAVLATLLRFLSLSGARLIIWVPLVLTNYYLLLLGFGVLRLKIAVLFLMLSWLTSSPRWRWGMMIAAATAHFQMALPLLAAIAAALMDRQRLPLVKLSLIACSLIFAWKFEAIFEKIQYYSGESAPFPTRMLVLFGLSLLLIDRHRIAWILILIFGPLAIYIGDGRLNIIYLLLVVHEYICFSRRTQIKNFALSVVGIYLSIKGISFAGSLIDGENFFDE